MPVPCLYAQFSSICNVLVCQLSPCFVLSGEDRICSGVILDDICGNFRFMHTHMLASGRDSAILFLGMPFFESALAVAVAVRASDRVGFML